MDKPELLERIDILRRIGDLGHRQALDAEVCYDRQVDMWQHLLDEIQLLKRAVDPTVTKKDMKCPKRYYCSPFDKFNMCTCLGGENGEED